jgi:hypothetical protein
MGAAAMSSPRGAGWLILRAAGLVALGLGCQLPESDARSHEMPTTCASETVGIDTSRANTYAGAFFGRSVAQVFYAPDTLIESITVWRPDTNNNDSGMHLFITEVDSLNRPDTFEILLDGPTIVDPGVVERPVVFAFDPPFALPRKGNFAFALKDESVACFGIFSLLADSTESYPYGGAYSIHPFVSCLGLGWLSYSLHSDIIFQMVLCGETVPTIPETWGRLKARYR